MPPEKTGAAPKNPDTQTPEEAEVPNIGTRPIALVGLMGVGKTTVGRRLAKMLGRPFYDSDDEIEKASGRTVAGYFRDHGEQAFREGERRVIDRILDGTPLILATGGGAFIPEGTRKILLERSTTIFLKGEFETLFARVQKKDTRPLLQVENPRQRYREIMDARYPIYANAHLTIDIAKGPHIRTVEKVLKYLEAEFNASHSTETTGS
ncbi:MAG: shikimate kinase [Maricaulaceae bacterium]